MPCLRDLVAWRQEGRKSRFDMAALSEDVPYDWSQRRFVAEKVRTPEEGGRKCQKRRAPALKSRDTRTLPCVCAVVRRYSCRHDREALAHGDIMYPNLCGQRESASCVSHTDRKKGRLISLTATTAVVRRQE